MKLSRRGVMRAGLAVGGGLLLKIPAASAAGSQASFTPDAYLRITADDVVTLILARTEMGQGTSTMHAQLIAEELELSPSAIKLEHAGSDRRYDNPALGFQLTGGSTSTAVSWGPYRQAGAVARELLISAAAKTWRASRADCVAREGAVVHTPTGQRLRYGELAEVAATMSAPVVKPREKDFKVIGKPTPRVDTLLKITGTGGVRPRRAGSRLKGGGAAALAGAGRNAQVLRRGRGEEALRRLARGGGAAGRGGGGRHLLPRAPRGAAGEGGMERRRAGEVRLEDPGRGAREGAGRRGRQAGEERGRCARGVVEGGHRAGGGLLRALPRPRHHGAAERDRLGARRQGGDLGAHAGADDGGGAGRAHARSPQDTVTVHTTWVGGGFGRRIAQDYVVEAVQVSKAIAGPVKVVWSREDDVRHSPLPARGDAPGARRRSTPRESPSAWHHRVASQSILSFVLPEFAGAALPRACTSCRARWCRWGRGR